MSRNSPLIAGAVILLLSTLLIVAQFSPVRACLNEYGANTEGKSVRVDGYLRYELAELSRINPSDARDTWELKIGALKATAEKEKLNYEAQGNYAVALIHMGEVKKAIEMLIAIDKQKPGDYVTVANLGTAYELDGQNEKALELIKKGVELNPDSHEGSEWIHVKILEAKLQLAKDPNWLKSHSVIGLNFGNEARALHPGLPAVAHNGTEYRAEDVAHHIMHQLHERLAFVSAPEPIVADLFFNLGNIYATTTAARIALPVYEMALKFGPVNKDFVQARRDHVAEVVHSEQVRRQLINAGLWVAGILVLALLFVLWRRGGSRVTSSWSLKK